MSLGALTTGTFTLGNATSFPVCNPQSIVVPDFLGAEIINIQTVPTVNYTLQGVPIQV